MKVSLKGDRCPTRQKKHCFNQPWRSLRLVLIISVLSQATRIRGNFEMQTLLEWCSNDSQKATATYYLIFVCGKDSHWRFASCAAVSHVVPARQRKPTGQHANFDIQAKNGSPGLHLAASWPYGPSIEQGRQLTTLGGT